MARIRCEVGEGLIPTERFARIERADGGVEEVAVSREQIEGDYLDAAEIGRREGRVLIELPRESSAGNWRVWVKEDALG